MSEDLKSLINRIAEEDNGAFRIFYNNYYVKVYRYASYFVKKKEIREEITSDVFSFIWLNRKRLPKIENLEGYLYTIIRNTSLSYIKEKGNDLISLEELLPDKHSNVITPEDHYVEKELSDAIQGAIDNLPERCRLIFLLAREDRLKYSEIAEKLSISEKTVNAQMVLAIKKLSNALKRILTILF